MILFRSENPATVYAKAKPDKTPPPPTTSLTPKPKQPKPTSKSLNKNNHQCLKCNKGSRQKEEVRMMKLAAYNFSGLSFFNIPNQIKLTVLKRPQNVI